MAEPIPTQFNLYAQSSDGSDVRINTRELGQILGGGGGMTCDNTAVVTELDELNISTTSINAKLPTKINDRVPVTTGIEYGSGPTTIVTTRTVLANDDPLVVVSTLAQTRDFNRLINRSLLSTSATNAPAVITLPAPGANTFLVVDQIVCSYNITPTAGNVSVSGVQVAPGNTNSTTTTPLPIVSAGPAPLANLRFRGLVNQPVTVTLAAGGTGATGVLWVIWSTEQS